MSSSFLKRNLLLFSSLLLLGFSYACWLVASSSQPDNRASVKAIGANLNEQIVIARKEASIIRQKIDQTDVPVFSSLLLNTKFPYFIFRNKGLYCWSDNHFAPNYDNLSGESEVKFISLRGGKYIVCKDRIQKRGDWFEIFSFIPLSNDYSIENNYISPYINDEVFENLPVRINSLKSGNDLAIYWNKVFLFSLEFQSQAPVLTRGTLWLLFLSSCTGLVFLLIYIFKQVSILECRYKSMQAFLLLTISVIGIRALLLKIKYPFVLLEFDLFSSKYFASSSLAPSMGDFLLNALVVFAFSVFIFRNYPRFGFVQQFFKLHAIQKAVCSVLIILTGSFSVYLFYYAMHTLFEHAQLISDITVNIDLNYFRLAGYLTFIILFITFFLFNHVLYRILLNLNQGKKYSAIVFYFVAGNFMLMVFSLVSSPSLIFLSLINFVYFSILWLLKLPRTLGKLKYLTYIYFLNTGFICSFLAGLGIYEVNTKVSLIEKQRFALQLLTDNDPLGEYLLNEAEKQIKEDVFIQKRLLDPFVSKDIIEQKIRRVFLGNYFDKFEVDIKVFDANGNPYSPSSDFFNFQQAEDAFHKEKYKTEYSSIFFLNDPESNNEKKYVSLFPVISGDQKIGFVLIQLKPEKVQPSSVYPQLLVDRKFVNPLQLKNYSYGVFDSTQLIYSSGSFNYEKYFPAELFKESPLFYDGVNNHGFNHMAVKGGNKRIVVVSSEVYSFSDVFSNFSFFFLVLILFILLFIISYAAYYRFQKVSSNFSTRIQIYLNIAFFLPLLIVSIATLSVISISYRDNLNDAFIQKAQGITRNITQLFESYMKGDIRKDKFEKSILQIARYTESDINLYTGRGRLLFTNQNMIYDAGLLTKFIHPEAYAAMINDKFSNYMLTESVGTLKYNVAYVGIKSSETGDLIGILSIPFFESKQEIDRQIIQVLTTTLNIFISIFIVFLILSYFASHILTVPLKIITEKINRISLSKNNEPIEWNSKDEIGLMVGEYNKMLLKLEDSKVALAKSEKESAWREMAKQVAHEIKNPLTPMKLTIQHLQRKLVEKSENIKQLTEKALDTLLDQVNNLSEIATSFSDFAKMPIPKYHRFEISSLLVNAINLHRSEDVTMQCDIPDQKFYVMGDEQLMTSIFTNLILNGLQSVPNTRKAEITASIKRFSNSILIEIRDNGTGIPANISDKVFIPNFSTKFTGSGIGLAVAKRGVEHAGGRIWFETIEGEGTSFFIELPLNE
ncbi:MAG: ATP-binding protein [Cytophagaceae bacterium]